MYLYIFFLAQHDFKQHIFICNICRLRYGEVKLFNKSSEIETETEAEDEDEENTKAGSNKVEIQLPLELDEVRVAFDTEIDWAKKLMVNHVKKRNGQ